LPDGVQRGLVKQREGAQDTGVSDPAVDVGLGFDDDDPLDPGLTGDFGDVEGPTTPDQTPPGTPPSIPPSIPSRVPPAGSSVIASGMVTGAMKRPASKAAAWTGLIRDARPPARRAAGGGGGEGGAGAVRKASTILSRRGGRPVRRSGSTTRREAIPTCKRRDAGKAQAPAPKNRSRGMRLSWNIADSFLPWGTAGPHEDRSVLPLVIQPGDGDIPWREGPGIFSTNLKKTIVSAA